MMACTGLRSHIYAGTATAETMLSGRGPSSGPCSSKMRAATRGITAPTREVSPGSPPLLLFRPLTQSLAFLSYLRLSVYMAVVSVAIVLSFHLKHQPTDVELRMAKPLGAVFWVLSVASLMLGLGNYISEPWYRPLSWQRIGSDRAETVNKYSRRAAIVQTGWRTQTVRLAVGLLRFRKH